jgi:hypothetical protein
VETMAGDRGGSILAAGAGDGAFLLLKSTTWPSGFLITMALLLDLGGIVKVEELGAGLAEVTLGV